jgi:hypothetical protein
MKRSNIIADRFYALIFCSISVLGLTGCGGDSGPTPGALAITTTSLPEGTINRPYSASVSGSGGALPYTWSVSPALPADLTLNPATGAITGTPTRVATTTHTFTLRDTSAPSQTIEQTLSFTIDPPLSITTTSLPDASIAAAYNQPVETVGGIGALAFSIVPGTGTLPQNFSLNPTTGMISGTPTAPAGNFPFTVRVADEGGQQDMQALQIRVTPTTPPNITTSSLSSGTVGLNYRERVQATGGIGELAWSVSAGSLPAGLFLEPSGPTGGTISGTPTTRGTSNFTLSATDSVGQSDTQNLSITVDPALSITTTSLPDASIGATYGQPVVTVGGIGALTFSIVSGTGTLPQNFSLNPTTGMISGTPTAPAGNFPFTVRVADEAGQQDTQALQIRVTPATPPQITTTSLPGGRATQPYNFQVQATGGIGALAWSVSAGALPVGLTLSSTGAISGTPTSEGPSNFTVTVTDSFGQSDTQALSITVSAAPLVITTTSLPSGGIGQFYSRPVQATGGTPPLTFSIVPPGTLPPGLGLNQTTGVISGTPIGIGTSSFTVRVADVAGQEDTQNLSITINLIVIP